MSTYTASIPCVEKASMSPYDYELHFSTGLGWTLCEIGSDTSLAISNKTAKRLMKAWKHQLKLWAAQEQALLDYERDHC
jgi:hypothetical protein